MRFSVQLPTEQVERGAELLSAEALGEMARAAEDAGVDACFVTDHPIPGTRWLAAGGHHSLDPFVALSFAAAATTRLRLQTHVLVLPYRNPFLVAKAAASLDVASGGRLILGVASGYLKPEFAALGADFDARNESSDEALEVLDAVWRGEDVQVKGRGFEAPGNTALPRPIQRPRPPVWVGGNSRRAIRRAVERADGWLPFPTPAGLARHVRTASIESLDDLAARLEIAREHAAAVGRQRPLDVCFVPFNLELSADAPLDAGRAREQVARLEELGVSWLALNVRCTSRADYLAALRSARCLLGDR